MTPNPSDNETDEEQTTDKAQKAEELLSQVEQRREESEQTKEEAFGLDEDDPDESDLHPKVAEEETVAGEDHIKTVYKL